MRICLICKNERETDDSISTIVRDVCELCAGEEWRPIPEYEGYYEISNRGRVKSIAREICSGNHCWTYEEKIMSTNTWLGYEVVWLRKPKHKKKFRVHRLVALAFLPQPEDPGVNEVNHKDKNRLNNNVENLEWMNHVDNCAHRDSDKPF